MSIAILLAIYSMPRVCDLMHFQSWHGPLWSLLLTICLSLCGYHASPPSGSRHAPRHVFKIQNYCIQSFRAIIFLKFWCTLYDKGSLIKGRINTSETHFVVFFIFPTNIQNSRYKKYISHEYSYKPLLRPTHFQLSFQFLLVHSSINFSQSSSNVTQCLRPLVMFFSSLSYEEILYHA